MALRNGQRREGSVKGGCSVPVHRRAAQTLDGFFLPLPDRCLKRGHSHEKESWSISLWLHACTHAGVGSGPSSRSTSGVVALSAFHVFPMQPGTFLNIILAVAILARLAEIPFGKYRKTV